jgi:PDZ domain-containing protein
VTRRIGLLLSLGVVAWAAIVVPMPFYEVQPGEAIAVEDLVDLSASVDEVRGDLELLTVRTTTPNVIEAIWVGLNPDRSLEPGDERIPPGVDADEYRELLADAFDTAFLTAVALAARDSGYEVSLQTRATVSSVLPGGPSDGLLLPGDSITAIDGTSVDSGTDLVELLQTSDEPRRVTLDVVRGRQQRQVTVDLRQLPTTDRPVLGILVETTAEEPDLPFDATLEESGIVGPSAGLMLALTAADLLREEDLAAGRRIAGTGTIDLDGRVGPVGGVPQKARAAVAADVDLLLVPLGQLDQAAAAAEAGIEVVGVATFQDALDALRGTGVAAP